MRWIVVGAGSGGCVAAARLADDPQRHVTLVEAGPGVRSHGETATIEGADTLAALRLPGRTFDGLLARRHRAAEPGPYRVGRGIGGSSAINAMLASRGDPRQYAAWGWVDAPSAWERVAIPTEVASDAELGPVDRALLAAEPTAVRAPLTRRHGRRVTSAEAYLDPRAALPNLEVRTNVAVDRLVLARRKARGVVLADGSEILADRVVVAAGAIHTPMLLLRSGIDAPGVGVGLQDHPSAAVTLELHERAGERGLLVGAVLERDGLQILPINHTDDGRHAALACALMTPAGRSGSVRLADDDPRSEPDVELDLLADGRDRRRLGAAVRLLLDILGRPSFAEIVGAAYIDEHGTSVEALDDDRSLERWLRSTSGVHLHASSTCAIGRVLDDRGAVLGYDDLYVCDASAFPSVPAGNPHLPTTMLAERLTSRWPR